MGVDSGVAGRHLFGVGGDLERGGWGLTSWVAMLQGKVRLRASPPRSLGLSGRSSLRKPRLPDPDRPTNLQRNPAQQQNDTTTVTSAEHTHTDTHTRLRIMTSTYRAKHFGDRDVYADQTESTHYPAPSLQPKFVSSVVIGDEGKAGVEASWISQTQAAHSASALAPLPPPPRPAWMGDPKTGVPGFSANGKDMTLEELIREKIWERKRAGQGSNLLWRLREFQQADRDGNGRVETKELYHFLRTFAVELDKRQLERLIEVHDTSGDGSINYQEFLAWILPEVQE